MSSNYISIGPAPANENCAQVGEEGYRKKALSECHRFIGLIREAVGIEPNGAQLNIKENNHDFGQYYEVVCHYDPKITDAVEYALKCEYEAPTTWEGERL